MVGAAFLACLPVAAAHADVNDFTVTYFGADYTLTAADRQGQMRIVEHIKVHFTDNNHGILRAIPTTYRSHRLQLHINAVSSDSGAPAKYSKSNSNGNLVLKIGDANQTVTGDQEYTVDYTVRNVIGFFSDHDELYWDVNGEKWGQEFQAVTATLHVPADIKLYSHDPACFTGTFGSQESRCSIYYDSQNHSFQTVSLRPLNAGESLTMVTGFQKGYFQPSTWRETLGEYTATISGILIPFAIIGGSAGLYWFKRGRDAKGRGVIVPEYDAPDDLKPLEVGTIVDFKTENRDLTATIIDLAIRGYIKIIESKTEHKLRHDTLSYTLRLMKIETKDLASFENTLLKAFFPNFQLHEEVSLAFMKYKLSQQALSIRKTVSASLTGRGYFRANPFVIMNYYVIGLYVGIGVVCFLLSMFHSAGVVWVGVGAGFITALLFLHFVPSRTLQGTHAKEHILGLKMYLKTAEADRLKMMQSPGTPYMITTQPTRTVELFEKLLPYAMVLGVEKEWAKQFEDVYKTAPDWYDGNWHGFSSVYLASAISDNMASSVNTAFGSSSSSGGSGFSGGGAGGGGGGGGGGGW
ncbi:MAG TPA: DUF2207 domain-containing protein [Patescibacteria group bacterium]|nr:DUF2207 domain-containing protein [Patescibacteria group bacterium]